MRELEAKQFKQLARLVLTHPREFEWSVQGFGMLRFYVTKEVRVHLWDSKLRVADVTDIHTHPWNFVSTVLWGEVRQRRYEELTAPRHTQNTVAGWRAAQGDWYDRYEMTAGADAFLRGEPTRVFLQRRRMETYVAGEQYHQHHREVHRSAPLDGTVTLVQRELADEDPDRAYTYVPVGEEWVDAAPRLASQQEVEDACHRALVAWEERG